MTAGAEARNGRLSEEPLPRLLVRVFRARLTGGIGFALPTGNGAIYLREGLIAAVELPGGVDRLGELLVASRVVEHGRLEAASAEVTGEPLGRALVDRGLIAESQLIAALRLQARRRLHRLFFVEESEFTVEEGDHGWGVEGTDQVRIHPHRAIYQGMKSAYREDRFGREIPPRPLRLLATPDELSVYGIVDADQAIISRFAERPHTAAEVVAETGMPLELVRGVVYALLVTGGLQVIAPTTAASPAAAARPKSDPNTRVAPAAARPRSDPDTRVPPAAAVPPRAAPPVASAVPRSDPNARVPPAAGGPPRAASGAAAAGPAAAPAPEALAALVAERLARLDGDDLFQVLGVARDADRAAIKSAYLEAARLFHPDRFAGPVLGNLKRDAERIFRRVSEANATLSDDTRRAAYLEKLSTPPSSRGEGGVDPARVIAAEMAFLEGEVAFKRRDYETAIARLGEAVELNPEEGEALALLAWARFSVGQATLAGIKHDLENAVRLSPRCARAHYFLGMQWKQAGDTHRALGSFRRAVELDEKLAEAQSELRVLQMRNSRDEPGSRGLLDRLRKK